MKSYPARNALSSRERRARQGATSHVQCSDSGRMLELMHLNLSMLDTEKNREIKVAGLIAEMKKRKYPDLVSGVELSGAAGATDWRDEFAEVKKQYDLYWSCRSVNRRCDMAPASSTNTGAGIILFVHKRLGMRPARQLPVPATNDEQQLLNGHLRVWRLDQDPRRRKKHAPTLLPIIITQAYVPPSSTPWGKKVRPLLFRVMRESDQLIQEQQIVEQSFSFTVAHSNAPDGAAVLKWPEQSTDTDPLEMRKLIDAARPSWKRRCGDIIVHDDGSRQLILCRSERQRKDTSTEGVQFIEDAARAGKLPTAGLMSYAQPTSWMHTGFSGGLCSECAKDNLGQCLGAQKRSNQSADVPRPPQTCVSRLKMRSIHDVLLLPADLVWKAKTKTTGNHLIRLQTKRIWWAQGAPVDHAVMRASFWVGQSNQTKQTGKKNTECARLPRRFRLTDDLVDKQIMLQALASQADCDLRALFGHKNNFDALELDEVDVDELDEIDVDELNEKIVAVMLKAQADVAKAAQKTTLKLKSVPHDIQELRATRNRARRRLLRAFDRREQSKAAGSVFDRQELVDACAAARNATNLVRKAERLYHANHQTRAHLRSPRLFWRNQVNATKDMGSPAQAATCLTDHQTNEKGELITASQPACMERMRQNRQDLYSVPDASSLGSDCTAYLRECEGLVRSQNRKTVEANPEMMKYPDSAVMLSATKASLQLDATDHQTCASAASTELERKLTLDEVSDCIYHLKDVGSGTDGLAGGAWTRMTKDGPLMSAIVQLLQKCLDTGTTPGNWQEHRSLFLYKAKGSPDPFHLGNYRGLGIDQLMCKVYTLLLNRRLEAFAKETDCLSRAQGGFQRQRGPPESILTVTETVRVSMRKKLTSYLLFLDIKEAYDSVLHPILWKSCVDKGISGKFLAALQSIYHHATARIDVQGELLDSVPIQRGVLQGNPLSPTLFNIYLDSAIRQLEQDGSAGKYGRPIGLYLPEDAARLDKSTDQKDYLPCQFFADDGTLLENDPLVLQQMMDSLCAALAKIGLRINVKKTKVLLVPPDSTSKDEYARLKADLVKTCPIKIYGIEIEVVDEFDYLGVVLWWRWNWDRAWARAQSRFRMCFADALKSGWQRRSGSMWAQLTHAQAKIFCHFNYLSAIAGAGGDGQAKWMENERLIGWVLKTITRQRTYHDSEDLNTTLRIESGTWDQRPRIDMLMLRFWAKITTLPSSSLPRRAVCWSMANLQSDERARSDIKHKHGKHQHKQLWAQSLLAAAARFGIPSQDILSMKNVLVEVQVSTYDSRCQWQTLELHELSSDSALCPRRLRLLNPLKPNEPVEDVSCWTLPTDATPLSARTVWTPPLQKATYANLRSRGNKQRHLAVRTFLRDQILNNTRRKRWAQCVSHSGLQAYWLMDDARLAVQIFRARIDECRTQDFLRHRPRYSRDGVLVDSIPNPSMRRCLICVTLIDGRPGVLAPDNLFHALCECQHVVAARYRRQFRLEVLGIIQRSSCAAGIQVPRLDTASDAYGTELYTIAQLCCAPIVWQPRYFGVAMNPLADMLADEDPLTSAALHNRDRHPVLDLRVRAATARWISALMSQWRDAAVNFCSQFPNPSLTPGAQLAAAVGRYIQRVFNVRASMIDGGTNSLAVDESLSSASQYAGLSEAQAVTAAALVGVRRPMPAMSVLMGDLPLAAFRPSQIPTPHLLGNYTDTSNAVVELSQDEIVQALHHSGLLTDLDE